MRFTYIDAMVDPTFLVPLAQAAEEAGFDSFAVPDSIGFPEHADSQYPYTGDGDREFLRDRPFIEPMSLIPALGAVTSRIRFCTFVWKLPMRHPVLAAKQVSSVAVLTGGRLDLGVGLSPWPEDYQLLDVPWRRRGKRFDEQVEILRGLMSGDFYAFDGEFFTVPSVQLCPVPPAPVPILFGGHSEPALRRAARLGDGWMHAGGGGGDDLDELLADLHRFRAEYDRGDQPFSVHAISLDAYSPEGVQRLRDRGVTDAIVGFRNSYQPGPDTETLAQKIATLQDYGQKVIARVR